MKNIFIIFTFSLLLLTSPLFGQSDEKCYVAVASSEDFDLSLLSNISVSLISQFLREVDMDYVYPGRGIISKKNWKLFESWHRSDPVDDWECKRAKRIERIQGNRNEIVLSKC